MGSLVEWQEEQTKDGKWAYTCTHKDEKGINGGIPNVRAALPTFQRRGILTRKLTEVMKAELVYRWLEELIAEQPFPHPDEPDKVWTATAEAYTAELKKLCPTVEGKPIDTRVATLCANMKTKFVAVEPDFVPVQPVKPFVYESEVKDA